MFTGLAHYALAICEAGKGGTDYLREFKFLEAFGCTYGNEMGVLAAGLLFIGGIAMSLYITTGDVRIPTVLLLLTGGVTTPLVAGPGLTIIVIMLLLTGAGLITAIYYRWSR